MLLLCLLCLFLTGCSFRPNTISRPSYLLQETIKLPTAKVNVQTVHMDIPAELARMLELDVDVMIKSWANTRTKAVGTKGVTLIRFDQVQLREVNREQYQGQMRVSLLIDGKIIKANSASIKNFDFVTTYVNKKRYLYELLQEMLVLIHQTIQQELKK